MKLTIIDPLKGVYLITTTPPDIWTAGHWIYGSLNIKILLYILQTFSTTYMYTPIIHVSGKGDFMIVGVLKLFSPTMNKVYHNVCKHGICVALNSCNVQCT